MQLKRSFINESEIKMFFREEKLNVYYIMNLLERRLNSVDVPISRN